MDNKEGEIRKLWNDYSGQRVHMVGEYMCVCWNLDWVTVPEGRVRKKKGKPYIDACYVYEIDENGIGDVSEDNPLEGGFGLEFAKQIHEELGKAIKYLEAITNEETN